MYPACLNYSVKNKFNDQMNLMRNLGFQVFYIQWNGKEFLLTDGESVSKVLLKTNSILGKEHYFHIKYFVDFFRSVNNLLKMETFEYICDICQYF